MDLMQLTARWRSPRTTGLDFGASHFKFVQLERRGDGVRLTAHGMAEAPAGEDEEAAIRRLRVYLREHPMPLGKVATNIEDDTLRIRRMDLPKMPERDLKVAIRWNFREQVDVPLEKYLVSYTPVPGKSSEKSNGDRLPFMAFGVAADAVTRCQARLKRLGLRAGSVEPNATALLAAFDHAIGWGEGGWGEGERCALLDLGFLTANFLVVGDRALLFSRPLAGVTGERFLRMIGREGTIPPEQARAQLKAMMGADTPPEGVGPALDEFYSQMLVEIQRSIDGYSALYHTEEGVKRLFLCGGGSRLPNLPGHLTKNLGVPTQAFDPFAKISDDAGRMPAPVGDGPLYAVAVGLALPPARKGKGETG